jgi:hypothetical protein
VKLLELFSGTKSMSHVFAERGHEVFTIDMDSSLRPDLCEDIRFVGPSDIPFKPDIIWASPPCQGFSVAAIGKNWNRDNTPKTYSARLAAELVEATLALIDTLKPRYYFIENPVGKLRVLPYLQHLVNHSTAYCQYGDTRKKPTDIWTNMPRDMWTPKSKCANGASCHVAAPRGSKTPGSTQGIKGAKDRGRIPEALCLEIAQACERGLLN